jgi:hypothetical protein
MLLIESVILWEQVKIKISPLRMKIVINRFDFYFQLLIVIKKNQFLEFMIMNNLYLLS